MNSKRQQPGHNECLDLWVQRFRPDEWDEAQYPPAIRRLKGWSKDATTPYCRMSVVHGPPGRGKTTLARILAHDFDVVEEINASDKRRRHEFQKILERVTDVIQRRQRSLLFVLDEADGMQDAQFSFLSWTHAMEQWFIQRAHEHGPRVRILILCNDISVMEPAILSRAWVLRVPRPSMDSMRKACHCILKRIPESVAFTPQLVDHIITNADGDYRMLINLMEQVVTMSTQLEPSSTDMEPRVLDVKDVVYMTRVYPMDDLRILFHPSLQEVPLEKRYECLNEMWNVQGIRAEEFIHALKWMQRSFEPDLKKIGLIASFMADLEQRPPRSVLGLQGPYSKFLSKYLLI